MFSSRSLTTVFILITQTKVFAQSAVTCSDIETETTLDFQDATVSESTLQKKTGKLQFDNVGSYNEGGVITPLNLVVKQVGKKNYTPGNVTQNRKSGDFGMINIDSNDGEGTFDFCFVDSEDKPKTLDAFFFSFYDLDGPKKGLESVELKLKDFTAYYVSTNSSIDIKKKENNKKIKFTATESGTGDDNPDDRNNLSSLQQDRSVVFQMEDVDCFQVKLSSKCNKTNKKCKGGRNFLFAGKASQIVPMCEPTPFPTVQPTKGPTKFPTTEPTPAPTKKPTKSPTTEPKPAPTKKPTKSPTKKPKPAPTKKPTSSPTASPTSVPTASPTSSPTSSLSNSPTVRLTNSPTTNPTSSLTTNPTSSPTTKPTNPSPTKEPNPAPTKEPTPAPTKKPKPSPTKEPTKREPVAPPTKAREGVDPGVAGDPHFKTWAGESYDFHGVCDLVLLKNTIFQNGLGLTIHIRTSRMLSWSFVSVVALRIGEDILEVIGGEEEDNFWINEVKGRNKEVGSKNDEMALVSTLSGYPVYYKEVNSQHREFEIVLGGTEKIKIGTWHSFVRIHLENAKSDHFGKSMGLMGSFSEGVTLARDNVTVLDEFNAFGSEWQVLHSEPKLFRVVEGPQHPTQCEIPSSLALRRRLADSTISLVDARKACADVQEDAFDLCLFDVLATNDEMTAGAY